MIGQSINQKYTVEKNIIKTENTVGGFNTVEYSVSLNDNNQLYKIVDKVDYDIPFSKLEVFENGSSVLINSFYGKIIFINEYGKEIKTSNLLKNIEVEYERNILSVVDNNILIIAFPSQNKNNSIIQIYNKIGVLENEFEISLENINGIAFSESLNQIFISNIRWNEFNEMEKKVTIFNNTGKIKKSLNANFEKAYFTIDNKFIASSNKSINVIDTNNWEIIFKTDLKNNYILLDVTYINKNIIYAFANTPTLVKAKWLYENATIIIIDELGKVKETKYINKSPFNKFVLSNYNNKLNINIDNTIVNLN